MGDADGSAGRRRSQTRSAWNPQSLGWILAVAIGTWVAVVARWGPDWPAQEFRAWVAARHGLVAWTSRWYGGEPLPGYSVLYPALAGLVGAGVVGVAATALAAWAACACAPPQPRRALWYAVAVAGSLLQSLLIGQIPFLLGTAFGLLAIRSLVRSQPHAVVGLFAALCSLSSPLAGASLLMAAPALAKGAGWRRVAALGAAAVGVLVALLVGGASGTFPFPWPSLAGVVAFCLLTLALTDEHNAGLRRFAICYLLAAVALFVIPNSIGANAARVGKLIAVPLAVRFVRFGTGAASRAVATAAVVLAMLWPTVPFVSAIARGASDPSQEAAYYAGLIGYLRAHGTDATRVEIPFTREHWEALWVARAVPIARGWERQTDLQYNAVLYRPLTAGRYRRWLDENAVTFVALPDAPIDYGGEAERTLLHHPPAYLQLAWHDRNWRVWRVVHPSPLLTGDAKLLHLSDSSMVLSFDRAGTAVVKLRASRLWRVVGDSACTDSTASGWLEVRSDRSGLVRLAANINPQLLIGTGDCD